MRDSALVASVAARIAAVALVCLALSAPWGPPAALAQSSGLAAVVDLEFDDAPVAHVFRSLADVAGLNVLVDPDVQGRVSLTLRQVPVRQATDLVARLTGYGYQLLGNTLVVASSERLQSSFQPLQFRGASVESVLWALAGRAGWNLVLEGNIEGELSAQLEGLDYERALALVGETAGLHYRLDGNVLYVRQPQPPAEPGPVRRAAIVRLNHVGPARTREVLASLYPQLAVEVDEQSRILIVEGADADVAAAERLVAAMDVPRRQVFVEARLEEVHVDALSRLGISWGEQLAVLGAAGTNPLVLTLDPSVLRGQLEALQSEGLAKILASPRLAAVESEPATILIGDRIPVVLQSVDEEGRISQTIEYFEVGIKLNITATVDDADLVTLAITTEVSSITGMTPQGVPHIRTREMSTVVRVRDGQSLVIGGLIQETEEERVRGLPLLSDVPFFGSLFSRKETDVMQTEMVVFLIPHVVRDQDVPRAAGAALADAESPGVVSPGVAAPGAVAAAAPSVAPDVAAAADSSETPAAVPLSEATSDDLVSVAYFRPGTDGWSAQARRLVERYSFLSVGVDGITVDGPARRDGVPTGLYLGWEY